MRYPIGALDSLNARGDMLGEALAGGVGRRLVRAASCPVALVPERTGTPSLDRVGVYPGSGSGSGSGDTRAPALRRDGPMS